MVKTFTPSNDLTVKPSAQEQDMLLAGTAEPSAKTIKSILDFSRNLEVRPSGLINTVEFIKS